MELHCSVLRVHKIPRNSIRKPAKRLWIEEETQRNEQAFTWNVEGRDMKFVSTHAPLAQLVAQLTLNQWVPGSSP